MPQDGKVDYVVFRNYLDHELKRLDFDARAQAETAPYTPSAATIVWLEETRKKTTPLKPQDAAAKLDALTTEIEKVVASPDPCCPAIPKPVRSSSMLFPGMIRLLRPDNARAAGAPCRGIRAPKVWAPATPKSCSDEAVICRACARPVLPIGRVFPHYMRAISTPG